MRPNDVPASVRNGENVIPERKLRPEPDMSKSISETDPQGDTEGDESRSPSSPVSRMLKKSRPPGPNSRPPSRPAPKMLSEYVKHEVAGPSPVTSPEVRVTVTA